MYYDLLSRANQSRSPSMFFFKGVNIFILVADISLNLVNVEITCIDIRTLVTKTLGVLRLNAINFG